MSLRAIRRPIAAALPDQPLPILIRESQQQQRPFWCWAACAAMILDRPATDQCSIVSSALNRMGCCQHPVLPPSLSNTFTFAPLACDETRTAVQVQALWELLAVPAKPVEGVLTEPELRQCITAGQPVQVWQGTNGPLSHVLLVVGCDDTHFLTADPFFPGPGTPPWVYEDLRTSRDGWQRSWILR
jgi:hypothetical protein